MITAVAGDSDDRDLYREYREAYRPLIQRVAWAIAAAGRLGGRNG